MSTGEPAAREQPAPGRSRFILDGEPQFGDGAGRIRPDPLVDQRRDMVLVLEARHGVVGLLFERGAGDAPRFLRLEQRQPAAMDQIVDEGRDEHRLAGPRQAGHAEPQRRRHQPGGALGERVEGDPRLVGERGERRQSGSLRVAASDIGVPETGRKTKRLGKLGPA